MSHDAEERSAVKLSKEQEAQLVERLHDRSIEHRIQSIKDLDARFYPTVPPLRMSNETIQQSVSRQVDEEMAKRRADHVAIESRVHQTQPRHTMADGDLSASVDRLYSESMEQKAKSLEENREKYLYKGPEVKRKKESEIKEYMNHLAVPKKREYTVDEINKVYGLA